MKWSVNLKDKFYDKAELDSKFDALVGFTTLVVNSLPVTGKNGIMYLLPSDESTESNNIYDEYIWVSDKFEKIGSTKTTVDLSGYVTQTEMNTQLANKANTNHTHDISALEDSEDMLGHMENDFYTALDTKANKTTATTSANGLMSKEDKSKLDGIATEANKTVVDSALSSSSTNPVQNKVVKDALDSKAGTSIATTSTNGLMSSSDKTKLDGIATGSTKVTVDSSLSSSSTNPVQNKVVNSALNGKANSSHNHSISNITNLQSALDNKSATGHTHDDRYYTKTEMNTELNGKANSSHTHSISNITNLQSALDEKAHLVHNHDNLYYTEAEIDEKLNGKADSSHTHNISDVTGLSTSLDGKMSNNYSESTIESNFFAHKIGNIVIVTWWNPPLPTALNSWVDWKTLPYTSCNTQPIWVDGGGFGREVRVKVPPNSNKLQIFISEGTGGIRAGMIVYPTK